MAADIRALLPILDEETWAFERRLMDTHWEAHEVSLSEDKPSYDKMTLKQQRLLRHILAFFLFGDELIIDALGSAPSGNREVKAFYTRQALQEQIHSESYSLQVQALGLDGLLGELTSTPVVHDMINWTKKQYERYHDRPFQWLVVSLCLEAIMFSGCFSIIYWFKDQKMVPGITKYNDFIARDENTHAEFTCFRLRKLKAKDLPPLEIEEINNLVKEAIDLSAKFIESAMPESVEGGINSEIIRNEIVHVAIHYMKLAGIEPPVIPISESRYSSVIRLALNETNKRNFFEDVTGTEYRQAERDGAALIDIAEDALRVKVFE